MDMTPSQLYQAGKLSEAVTAALEAVKKHPTDTQRRGQLCEMLCLAGDLERADRQLDTIGQQDPQAMIGVSLWRQLVRADTARQDLFAQARPPEFVTPPTPAMQTQLKALVALHEGNEEEAARLLSELESMRPRVRGVCDGQAFEDFRDLDDRTSSVLEVLSSTGKYFWVPFDHVRVIEVRPPQRPRDLLWLQVYLSVVGGPDGEVYLPTIYAGTVADGDDQLRLGRGSDWRETPSGIVRGLGQRMFLVGEEARSILELKHLEFEVEESSELPEDSEDEA